MKIAIDARPLSKNRTGIGNYVYEVIKCLNEKDRTNEYFLYSTKPIELDFKLNENWNYRIKSSKSGSLWVYFNLYNYLIEDKIDVLWGTCHILPCKKKSVRYILTIYDLAVIKYPKLGTVYNYLVQLFFVKKSCKRADKIIAISQHTKKDIVEVFGIQSEIIDISYPGLNDAKDYVITKSCQDFVLNNYGINADYILYIGTLEPRKNILTLVQAYEKLRRRDKRRILLVLAGGYGWKYQNVMEAINQSDYKEDIILTGYVSERDKNVLYHNGLVFAYPSIYEGFGLPVIEAMQAEIPVITSQNSSLTEAGGEAAFYIGDCFNSRELADRLEELSNLDKKTRQDVIQKGVIQSKRFRWSQCAENILHCIEND